MTSLQVANADLRFVNPSIQEIDFIAKKVAQSSMFPSWKGRENDAAVAILFGRSIGLTWGYSLLNIMVVNGRPTIWGDAMLALCKNSSLFESCHETFDKETMTATCTVKRKGEEAETRTFSKEDAVLAKLWGKNVWASYPQRMLQMRARAFALRDVFPDILQGLGCTEEIMDYPEGTTQKMSVIASTNKADKIFQRFEQLGIERQAILSHYEKQSVHDFSDEELSNLIETGKAVADGSLKACDAFPAHVEKSTQSDALLNKGKFAEASISQSEEDAAHVQL